jgi:hypothetical protein
MRETLGSNEVADLQQTYDDLLDLGVRIQAEYHRSYGEISSPWEDVIRDLMKRRTLLLQSIEPGLARGMDVARAVQGVTDAFASLPMRPMSDSQVSDADVSRSLDALLPAAKEYGYQAAVIDNELSLRKGDLDIRLGFMAREAEPGLGPHGGVRYLEAHVCGEFLVQFNGTWESVATDSALQREVDRAVAIFG